VNDLILYAFGGMGALLYAFPMFLAARKSGDADALATSTRMARLADRRLCANCGVRLCKGIGRRNRRRKLNNSAKEAAPRKANILVAVMGPFARNSAQP
jgi:hypothetical protein